MKRLLVLGAAGMLGHKLCQVLRHGFDVWGSFRGEFSGIGGYPVLDEARAITSVSAFEMSSVVRAVENVRPDVVINCIGIIKSRDEAKDRLLSVWVNSLFPHQLYQTCGERGARLIHVSTDCVFSGKKGNYREDDSSDAEDIYGKTKYLGEMAQEGALTIRTSLIGRELSATTSLIEWFVANRGGRVNGFTEAIFSGFPTLHFARIIADIITNHVDLSGLYHVSSDSISKFDLLTLINQRMDLGIEIVDQSAFHCDRSLDSTAFRSETGFAPLSWDTMISEFAEDASQYHSWRQEQ